MFLGFPLGSPLGNASSNAYADIDLEAVRKLHSYFESLREKSTFLVERALSSTLVGDSTHAQAITTAQVTHITVVI